MTQFDPSMVAEMLMSPIRRASENLGGGPMGIGADAGGSYFVDPEVAGRTGYGTAVTGASFFPGAGIVDAYGGAVDISGQPLPSFSENIGQGNYLDAALQGLGVAGDVATFAAPATLGASAVLGAMLKAPRAATKYKFENPIKVYQGRSKKGTKDFINPTDFYGDEKVSFATTELATADQFANKQTVNYPGRAKDGSEGPTKTTLIPGDVAELEFDIQNPLEVNRKDIGFKRDNEKAVIAEAKAKGHDGLKIVNDVSDKVDYVAFDSEQVRVVNPSLYPDRDYDYSPTSAELPSDVGSIAKVEPQSLPLDKASRLERARELGFDVDNPIYHGTNTDKLTEFDESKIGSRDEGFFGRGFYFADNAGEAGYYGKNVGEYFVRGDLLDLTDTSGEPNYLGSPLVFINWAEKLDKIDMLDDTHKQALKGAKKVVKYFDENVKILPAQNADGTTGYTAKIIDPTDDGFDGDPREIFMRSRYDDGFPKTQEEAKERLFYQFADDVRTSFNKDTDFFDGFDNDFLFSLSDYIREGGDVSGQNASKLTEKAKAAGFDGIRAGDETVIFDAKNIRSSDAAFDPEKTDSPQLLSSVMQDSMTAVA